MKYIRKGIALILIVVFIAAVAIGLGVIFAVRNVNICTVGYSSEDGESSEEFSGAVASITSSLSSLKGKSMLGVDEDDVISVVEDSGYAGFVSVEKVYPCTINVTVKEKFELYAVQVQGEDGMYYNVYDSDFSYIAAKSSNVNNLDGAPNVLISGISGSDYGYVATVSEVIEENIAPLRVIAERFSTELATGGSSSVTEVLTVELRCGLTLELYDYRVNTAEKAVRICEVFAELDEESIVGGTLTCRQSSDGELVVIKPDNSFA